MLYTNRNIIIPKKVIKNLKANIYHEKSNTCILDSDINKSFPKKILYIDKNNSKRNKKIIKNNKSNRKIISKIISKIKNVNSAIFQINNSFNKINTKRLIINKKIHKKSISPIVNKFNWKKINFELIQKLTEYNSTPNICNMYISKNNKKEKKIIKKENKFTNEKGLELKLTKTNSNFDISLLNKFLTKNDSSLHTNNHKEYTNNIKSLKNIILRKSFKNKIKKNKNGSKKVYLNAYKITPNIINHKYYSNNNSKIILSNEEMTISRIKGLNEQNFESIKVVRKHRTLNSKKIKNNDINNNININININSNNIYNNTNNLNYSNYNSIQNSSSINTCNNSFLNKLKYYDLLKKSSSFISKYPLGKKLLLSSSINTKYVNNLCDNSKNYNYILEEINKKKNYILNTKNITLTFNGCKTSRNSHNLSKIKYKSKKSSSNKSGNLTNFSTNKIKMKKDFLNKKEIKIHYKNKIPLTKSSKAIKNNALKK